MNDNHQHRWIMEFTEAGPAKFLGTQAVGLPYHQPFLNSLTQPPHGTPYWMTGLHYYHLGMSPSEKPVTEDRYR